MELMDAILDLSFVSELESPNGRENTKLVVALQCNMANSKVYVEVLRGMHDINRAYLKFLWKNQEMVRTHKLDC